MGHISDRHATERKDIPGQQRGGLNEEFMGGMNYGMRGPHLEQGGPRASEMKERLVKRLPELSGVELDQLPIMPLGASLEEGATYLDPGDPSWCEFTAFGGMVAEQDHRNRRRKPPLSSGGGTRHCRVAGRTFSGRRCLPI
jgi:hypothetical protein